MAPVDTMTALDAVAPAPNMQNSACPMCRLHSARTRLRAPDRFHGRKTLYTLTQCSSCGLVRLQNPPEPEEMNFHYGESYHQLIETAGESELLGRWKRQRETILRLGSSGRLLDIGCSSGAFLRTLKGSGWQLNGIEISAEEARKAVASTGADVFVGDPLDAPFAPESFDVITCFHLLEHVYQPIELLGRVSTWLKPGGHFYVILPNIDSWEARLFGSYWYGLELPRHLFHFSPATLQRAAQTSHLKTVKLHTLQKDSFSEHSFHYIFEELFARVGIAKAPLSAHHPASFLLKVVRKCFRLTIELLAKTAASVVGRGASIEGLFVKQPASPLLP